MLIRIRGLIIIAIAAIVLVVPLIGVLINWIKGEIKKHKKYIKEVKAYSEFESMYAELCNIYKVDFEKDRKKIRWRTVLAIIGVIVCYMAFSGFVIILEGDTESILTKNIAFMFLGVGIVSGIMSIIIIKTNYKHKGKYKKKYKEEIISKYIKFVSEKLNYTMEKTDSSNDINEYILANFDYKKFDKYKVDDYIEGFIDEKTFVKMCDMCIGKLRRSRYGNYEDVLFEGMFVKIQGNKDIGAYIEITKNKFKIKAENDRVEMGSQEFDKYFDVYSENKILAMKLLTADIMQVLTDFYNKYMIDFDMVFNGSDIYLRFSTGKMFEPKIFGNLMNKKLLFNYYCIMKFIVEIAQKVNKVTQEIDI